MSLYLQQVLGHGPALTGTMFLPFTFALVAGSVLAVKLGYRVAPALPAGHRRAAHRGRARLVRHDQAPTAPSPPTSSGPRSPPASASGCASGPVVSAATAGVAPHETGTASGLLNSSRQIGASLGLAALGTAAHHRTGRSGTPGALDDGYALGLTLGAALVIAAVVVALTVLRRPGPPVRAGRPPRAVLRGARLPAT